MIRYLLRRLLYSFAVLLGVLALIFVTIRLSPQDPVKAMLRLSRSAQGNINPEEYAAMKHRMGLDRPIPVQFADYVGDVVRGDFGDSYVQRGRTVNEILGKGIPVSATIGLLSLGIQIVLGGLIGIYAAARQNSTYDRTAMAISIWLGSIPQLVVGIFLIVFFGVQLRWLPIREWGTAQGLILPLATLSLYGIAQFARFDRAVVLEQMRQDFVRTARAKGVSERRILYRHVLRNALIPIVTFIGPSVAFLVVGNFVVETMFGIPGIAYYSITALLQGDYPVAQATVFLFAAFTMGVNLLIDLAYGVIDPRVRINR